MSQDDLWPEKKPVKMNSITFRSTKNQAKYEQDIREGMSRDLRDIPGPNIGSLKILQDNYGMDLIVTNEEILVDKSGNAYEFWHRFIDMYLKGQFPCDFFFLNNSHRKSQPQIEHLKMCDVDEDKIKFMRLCDDNREAIEKVFKG